MPSNTPVEVVFPCMLVEAGMLTNGLSPYASSMVLAGRVEAEQKQAAERGDYKMTLRLSPFEAGLMFQGLAQAQSSVCDDLLDRLHKAIIKLVTDLGITEGPGLGSDQPGGLVDDVPPQPIIDEPAPADAPSAPEDAPQGPTGGEGDPTEQPEQHEAPAEDEQGAPESAPAATPEPEQAPAQPSEGEAQPEQPATDDPNSGLE